MFDADRVLRQAAEDLESRLTQRTIPETPLRPAARARRVAWAIAAAAFAVAGLVWLTAPGLLDDHNGEVVSPSTTTPGAATTGAPPTTSPPLEVSMPSSGPLFGEETGVVLLFDDGLTGLTAVDPDRRLVSRSWVEGQRPGDEPFSMVRVGNHLVVGWGEPHAVDILTRQATSLGNALIFLPGVEDDRVWMVNDPWGSPVGARPRVWQVSLDGESLGEPQEIQVPGAPAIGIGGGLALQTENGLTLWEAASGKVRSLGGSGHGIVFDSAGDELVWCQETCSELQITDTRTLETQALSVPNGYDRFVAVDLGSGDPQTSPPDNRYIAALLARNDLDEVAEGEALWVYDRASGGSTVVAGPGPTVSHVAWSHDGTQVFASRWSYGEKVSAIWRYHLETGSFSSVVVPFGGFLSPVVVDSADAASYFGDELIPMDRCGVGVICTFEF